MSLFKHFPPIYNTLGQEADKLPVLDIGNDIGLTEYIDFIKPEEMSHPIMIGTDCCKRPFISIKVRHDNGEYAVGTFFQRYTDEPEIWAYGTAHGSTIYDDTRFRCPESFTNLTERLRILFHNKTIKERPSRDKINGDGPGNITLIY